MTLQSRNSSTNIKPQPSTSRASFHLEMEALQQAKVVKINDQSYYGTDLFEDLTV